MMCNVELTDEHGKIVAQFAADFTPAQYARYETDYDYSQRIGDRAAEKCGLKPTDWDILCVYKL